MARNTRMCISSVAAIDTKVAADRLQRAVHSCGYAHAVSRAVGGLGLWPWPHTCYA